MCMESKGMEQKMKATIVFRARDKSPHHTLIMHLAPIIQLRHSTGAFIRGWQSLLAISSRPVGVGSTVWSVVVRTSRLMVCLSLSSMLHWSSHLHAPSFLLLCLLCSLCLGPTPCQRFRERLSIANASGFLIPRARLAFSDGMLPGGPAESLHGVVLLVRVAHLLMSNLVLG